ncbi:MAG: hypothetical protein QXH80_00950, partial [Candidatus Nanoarchaeia archaeon]
VEPARPFKFKGCKVGPISEYELRIEVDLKTQSIDRVMDFLLKQFKIVDITISDPEIEEIIKEIYRK